MNSRRWIVTLLVSALLTGTCAPEGRAEDTPQASAEAESGSTTAAAVSNILYVPGKAIVCGLSGVAWTVTMLLTFGALYKESTNFVKGGCSGQWILTADDFKSEPARAY